MASRRGEPLFLADWDRVLFFHFEVDSTKLQPYVPFELDLFEGKRAFVSLVAFTMRNMRFPHFGNAGALLTRPIATHPFLNVRTYVKSRGEPGIFFLREWMNNRLARVLGPTCFGLPYRLGKIDYRHDIEGGHVNGTVLGKHARLLYRTKRVRNERFRPAARGSLDEFLAERYTAFVRHRFFRGFFRIWHSQWAFADMEIEASDLSILREVPGGTVWMRDAIFRGTRFSPGFRDVWMGRPHRL